MRTAADPTGAGAPPRVDRRRAAGIVLVAVLVATACGFAGAWQWSRHDQRSTMAERVEANYDAPARPVEDVLDAGGALPPEAEWSTVTLRGRYLAREPVLLRNRPVDGRPVVRLLHPVTITDGPWSGRVVVVDRGWVATADGGGERRPTAPDGVVTLELRLRPAEPGPTEPSGERQVRTIVPAAVAAAAGTEGSPLRVYGLLVTEDGAPPGDVEPLPAPRTTLGNNLSYAFQWWVFALGALGGAVVLIRRDQQAAGTSGAHATAGASGTTGARGATGGHAAGRDDVGPAGGRGGPPPGARRRRRPTAEEEEDALLDAQLDTEIRRGAG